VSSGHRLRGAASSFVSSPQADEQDGIYLIDEVNSMQAIEEILSVDGRLVGLE